MLNGDTCVRFFNEIRAGNLDFDVLQHAYDHACFTPIEGPSGIHLLGCQERRTRFGWKKYLTNGPSLCSTSPECITCNEVWDFVEGLCLDTVYSCAQPEKVALLKQDLADPWKTLFLSDVLFDRTLIEGRLIRFRFEAELFDIFSNVTGSIIPGLLFLYASPLGMAWLSQAHRYIEVSIGGSGTFIPHLQAVLCLQLQLEQYGDSAPENLQKPTFLFEYRRNTSQISSLGRVVRYLSGLSTILDCVSIEFYIWSEEIYNAVHTWQIARGFNPTTTDFAHSLGLPILEPIVRQNDRFGEPEAKKEAIPMSLVMPDSESDEAVGKEETTSPSTGSWWSWSTTPQSGISAFAIL
ncbi:hypothetical protein Moror_16801 [Moniliophthora roreri MCA 2997]|uniref:Uncharacterized protein n=1 Tax=Moniliophthora roreri (strain MCA 2997) TaxID=1381753 RepID=V2WSG2_MONRO|nr:hypothetical protein Moror_16801 [Moniliophthora roreri MCA 2997]